MAERLDDRTALGCRKSLCPALSTEEPPLPLTPVKSKEGDKQIGQWEKEPTREGGNMEVSSEDKSKKLIVHPAVCLACEIGSPRAKMGAPGKRRVGLTMEG